MSTIQDLFQQAQLAQAAYASFFDNAGNLVTTNAGVIRALQNGGMSETQATAFVAQWRVVDQMQNTTSGFSATTFERLNADGTGSGQYAFAPRGTEPFAQGGVDLRQADLTQIRGDGLAYSQIVDMYNYWGSLKATAGQSYQAAQLQTLDVATQELQRLAASHYAADQAAYQNYKSGLQGRRCLPGA